MKYGFIKVASSIPAVKVGDVIFNTQQIEEQIALDRKSTRLNSSH